MDTHKHCARSPPPPVPQPLPSNPHTPPVHNSFPLPRKCVPALGHLISLAAVRHTPCTGLRPRKRFPEPSRRCSTRPSNTRAQPLPLVTPPQAASCNLQAVTKQACNHCLPQCPSSFSHHWRPLPHPPPTPPSHTCLSQDESKRAIGAHTCLARHKGRGGGTARASRTGAPAVHARSSPQRAVSAAMHARGVVVLP
jgi:hypothetical protein